LVNFLKENVSIYLEYCTKSTKGTLQTQYRVGQHPDRLNVCCVVGDYWQDLDLKGRMILNASKIIFRTNFIVLFKEDCMASLIAVTTYSISHKVTVFLDQLGSC